MKLCLQGRRITVMIIDGGNKVSGAALADHVTRVYGTETVQHVLDTLSRPKIPSERIGALG